MTSSILSLFIFFIPHCIVDRLRLVKGGLLDRGHHQLERSVAAWITGERGKPVIFEADYSEGLMATVLRAPFLVPSPIYMAGYALDSFTSPRLCTRLTKMTTPLRLSLDMTRQLMATDIPCSRKATRGER
jgi:hypothetical protein